MGSLFHETKAGCNFTISHYCISNMPKLNDYIGSLVSSITNARVMSDMLTVKVAEEYAKHSLLKHFAIPRMRVDDVEMTIPVALDEINEQIETEYEPIDTINFNAIIYRELVNGLGLSKLPGEVSRKLRAEIARQTQIFEQNIRTAKNLSFLSTYCVQLSYLALDLEKSLPSTSVNIKKAININILSQHLEKILSPEIKVVRQKKSIGDLNVIVESSKLREQKPESLIYIKLKISEDGMEWNRAENSSGGVEEKLLPE